MSLAIDGKKQNTIFRIVSVLTVLLVLSEIVLMVLFRETWVDEIFSAFKSYLYLKGELVPFVSGLFEYPPLVIPTYGLVHFVFGPSLISARILSSVFFSIMLVLLFLITKRHAGKVAGIFSVLLVASNLLLVGNFVSATMYSLVSVLTLGVVYVEGAGLSLNRRMIFSGILIGLAILARTNLVVLALGYLLFLIVNRTSISKILLFLITTLSVIVVGYLPLISANTPLALSHIFSPFGYFGPLRDLPPSLKTGSQDIGRFLEVLTMFMKEYFGIILLSISVNFYVIYQKKNNLKSFIKNNPVYVLITILSLVFVGGHYLYWRIVSNVYYANYFIPLFILATVIPIFTFLNEEKFLKTLLTVLILVSFGTNLYRTDVISDPRQESDLDRLSRGVELIHEYIPEGSKVLSFDNSINHVFLSDRRTFMPLINRDFLFMPNADTEKIRDIGFYNMSMLKSWALESDYLALEKEYWPGSFLRSPFWGAGTEDVPKEIKEIQNIFNDDYVLVAEALNVYPRKYTDGNDGGTLQIYKRIK